MKERTILINVDKLELVGNDNDFIYILYNEFSLGAFLSKQNNVLVYTYGDKDVARLKRAVIKYGIDDKYYDELFGDKNETLKNKVKNNINFMGRITGVVNESESFTKALRLIEA